MMPRHGRSGAESLKDRAVAADEEAEMNRAPDTRRQRNQRRVVFVIVAALAAIGSMLANPSRPVAASPSDEAAFVAAINQVRIDNGLPALTVNVELSNLSRAHSQVMADAGEIFHGDPISAGYSGPWSKLGENVGVGASVQVLVDAFVASPGHFANIIDPGFTQIGVGVVWKDSALYTTHRFLQLPGAAPAPAAPPATTAAPPPTTVPQPVAPPTTTTTTTTLAPLAPPAITAERVMVLLGMLEKIGT
jgi:uncharacterized protein YkwD